MDDITNKHTDGSARTDAEDVEARPAPFPASLPPRLVMQWLPLCEVAAALRVAWSWRLDSEHYFRVFAERHRSLASGAGCGSLYFKWEDRALCHMQMQRSGRLTQFQEQVFRYYADYAEFQEQALDWSEFRFIPIGEVIRDIRLVVHDATAEQVKAAVAKLVSWGFLRASTTGEGHIEDSQQRVLQQRVSDYYEEHATSEEGLSTNAVAAGLSIDPALVRMAVHYLRSEGGLYSTIDDDHHKYQGEPLSYLYGAPDWATHLSESTPVNH